MIFIPDAEAPSVYGWCVDAPGFAPLGREMDDVAEQWIDAALVPASEPVQCPSGLDRDKLEQGKVQAPAV